jgi:hypothetical protein
LGGRRLAKNRGTIANSSMDAGVIKHPGPQSSQITPNTRLPIVEGGIVPACALNRAHELCGTRALPGPTQEQHHQNQNHVAPFDPFHLPISPSRDENISICQYLKITQNMIVFQKSFF